MRKSFTNAFKREAVRLAKERGSTAAIVRDLGISDTSLGNWKKQIERQYQQQQLSVIAA